MANLMCRCGNRLWNGRVPNEIEIHAIKVQQWQRLLNNKRREVLDWPEYDIWRCVECERLYLFIGRRVRQVFALHWSVEESRSEECSCKKYEFIVYTDRELDNYTLHIDWIQEMPLPKRRVTYCGDCNMIFVREDGMLSSYKKDE